MAEYDSMDVNLGRHALALARQEWGKPQPLDHALGPLVSEPDRSCTVGGYWYVVSIEHQQGALAKAEIAARGMVAYLPLYPHIEQHGRGRHRTIWRPLFGLYMFIRCVPAQWGLATAARGMRRFLGRNGQPEPVEDDRIEVIRLMEAEEACKWAAAEEADARAQAGGYSGVVWHFSQGDKVRIKNGPFAGFYADLMAAVDVHDRVKALTALFGRANVVELSAFDIEKAGA